MFTSQIRLDRFMYLAHFNVQECETGYTNELMQPQLCIYFKKLLYRNSRFQQNQATCCNSFVVNSVEISSNRIPKSLQREMKKTMAIHLAYAIAAIHLVYSVAIAIAQPTFDDDIAPIQRVILPEPLPLIPGPGGSWSPESQPSVDSLISMLQEQASSVSFDYSDGPNGPDHWGELKADWSLCKSGFQQSPLAITPTLMITDSTLGDLKANYTSNPVNVTVSHDGQDLKVELPSSAGVLKVYNITYRPVSFHFHRPSEHRILNYSFPLELHLVHKSEDNRIAVIAWLFVPGSTNNTFLAQFLDELPTHKKPYQRLEIPPIKLPLLEPNYGRYRGSLTTPPCSETVIWTVMLWNFPSVSDYQLKQLKAAMPKKNARPSFPSRGRKFRINHTPKWTLMEQTSNSP